MISFLQLLLIASHSMTWIGRKTLSQLNLVLRMYLSSWRKKKSWGGMLVVDEDEREEEVLVVAPGGAAADDWERRSQGGRRYFKEQSNKHERLTIDRTLAVLLVSIVAFRQRARKKHDDKNDACFSRNGRSLLLATLKWNFWSQFNTSLKLK